MQKTTCLVLASALLVAMAFNSAAQERQQSRSMVINRYGIVAAEHPLAAQTGAMILHDGGNAVDAIVATNAVMGVVAPMMNGIGGDLFAIVYEAKTGKLYGLNASGWAPAGLTIDKLTQAGHRSMPQHGIHPVTVPGCVDGWDKLLTKFGTRKFADVLAPAIRYADEGFPVPELTHAVWVASERALRRDDALKIYFPNGHAPATGDIFRNPELAWSLRQIAQSGRDAYYKGEIAAKILKTSQQRNGTMEAGDLADFSAEWVDPISTTYRGWTVYEMPPNGQGVAALEMLNIMEQFSEVTLHRMIEAKKLAYADLRRYVADPKFAQAPLAQLLSKDYAKERAKLIDDTKAKSHEDPGDPLRIGNDTTYLCAVDKEGNMVSLIQSNYEGFGSGLTAEGAGFALQNRGALFTLNKSHPNALAGHKRPFHTIIPAMMTRGDVRIAFGIMGGFNQSQAHAQFVSNVVDRGLNIQAALEAPRFTKMTFEGNDVDLESRFPLSVRAALEAKGHQIQLLPEFSGKVGGGQAVLRDFSTSINFGASDPRKDGEAVPEPIPNK
jgi:gamma-glutamyltranspeptidase/glutathione hydrolase